MICLSKDKIDNNKIVNEEYQYNPSRFSASKSYITKHWVRELQGAWCIIKVIVCNWRKGLLTGFPDIPTQICNFL